MKRIVPSNSEMRAVNEFTSRLLSAAKRTDHEAVVCGSIGKGTWLAGDHDIDLFVFFSKDLGREELEKMGLAIGKQIVAMMGGTWRIKYAEHPYVHAMINGFDVDIVPCYKIAPGEHIKSAVDRSPLHLAHVRQNLKPEQQNEVRLLKQFCKGAGVYGADTKTQGISGYICELLVMHYGSFEAVLRNAAGWRPPTSIGQDARKFDAPLIIIDPTDANRNAAAAVSAENFARFVWTARQFIKRPAIDFFFPKTRTLSSSDIKKLKSRKTRFVAAVAPRPDVIDDVLWPQLRRARHRLVKELEQNEFRVIRSFEWAEAVDHERTTGELALVFELETWSLPPVQRMHGPPITAHEHSARFLEKYGKPLFGPFVDGQGNWFIEKARNFETADQLLAAFLKRPAKDLEAAGIPNFVASALTKHKLIADDAFWRWAKRSDVSALMWKKYLKKLQ